LAAQENQNPPRAHFHPHPHHAALILGPREQGERRVSEGERPVARVRAHPRSMGPKMVLLYAILGSFLRNCFVSLLWIRLTDTQGRETPGAPRSQFDHYACFPVPFHCFSPLPAPSPPLWRSKKPRPRSCSLVPNPTVTRGRHTERKTAPEMKRDT
jgi:hypothetical protein